MSLQEVQRGGVPRLDMAPERLRPELATAALPAASAADLRLLRTQGWMRFGIVAAVVDNRKQILMLEHRASSKAPGGALGPLAETSQIGFTARGVVVETTQETLARGLREELGQPDPTAINLQARNSGSWELYSWPVGVNYGNQRAFAVCPVLHVDAEQRERLQDEFTGTEEISAIRFMSPDAIEQRNNLRPGTQGWLGVVAASSLMEIPPEESINLMLPPGAMLPGAVDARLQEVQL